MSEKNRETLKSYFKDGELTLESSFHDFIDTYGTKDELNVIEAQVILDGYTYIINSSDELLSYNFTDIPDNFATTNSLTSAKGLQLGNSVSYIGDYAFYNCSSLTRELVIPDSVTSIGSYAFYGCSGLLGDLVISNSIVSIGKESLVGLDGLTAIYINASSSVFVGTGAFLSTVKNLYVHSDYLSEYDVTWKTAQDFTGNVLEWTSYPNVMI